MLKNDEWVYREVYGCHYLMSIKTNEILCISPLVGRLFENAENLNVDKWCVENSVTENDRKYLIEYMSNKGVLHSE